MAEHGTALAQSANGQFELYRLHFDGKRRPACSLSLLDRIVATLKGILGTMEELQVKGLVNEQNDRNIHTVRGRLTFYEQELKATRSARAAVAPTERVDGLAEEANGLFNAYRSQFAGKSRHVVDPAPLAEICDRLHVVARQMADLEKETGMEVNSKNLETVLAMLKQYEREHERIDSVRA